MSYDANAQRAELIAEASDEAGHTAAQHTVLAEAETCETAAKKHEDLGSPVDAERFRAKAVEWREIAEGEAMSASVGRPPAEAGTFADLVVLCYLHED